LYFLIIGAVGLMVISLLPDMKLINETTESKGIAPNE